MDLSDGQNALEERRVCCCYRESYSCSLVFSAHGTVNVLTELSRLSVIIIELLKSSRNRPGVARRVQKVQAPRFS